MIQRYSLRIFISFIFSSSFLLSQNKMNDLESISEEPLNDIILDIDNVLEHNDSYISINKFLEQNDIVKSSNAKDYDKLIDKQNFTTQRNKPKNWNRDYVPQSTDNDIKMIDANILPRRLQKLSGDDILIFTKSTYPAIDLSEATGDIYITFNYTPTSLTDYPALYVYKSSDSGTTWDYVVGAYNTSFGLNLPIMTVLKDYVIVSYERNDSIGIMRTDISSAATGTTFKTISIANSSDSSVNDEVLWGSIISDKFYYDESNTWTYMNYLVGDNIQNKGNIYYLVSYDQGANWSTPARVVSDAVWGMRYAISTGYTTPEPYTEVDYLWFTWLDYERNVYATEVDVYEVQKDVNAAVTNHKIISDTDNYNAFHGTITTYFDKIFITGVIDWEGTDNPITSNTNRDVYMSFSDNGGADWGANDYSWYYWTDSADKQEERPVATYGTNGVLGFAWTYDGDLRFRTNSTGEFLQGWDKSVVSDVNSSGRIMIATAIKDSTFHYAYNAYNDTTGIYYNKQNMIKAKLASLTGNVTNALDGSPIANATVTIAGLTTTTNSNGAYELKDIKPGYVNADFSSNTQKGSKPLEIKFINLTSDGSQAIDISASNFISYEGMIKLKPGQDYTFDFSLSPVLGQGEIRAVLNWGSVPYDLDAHLFTPEINGSKHQIYWNNIGSLTEVPYAALDHDDTLSYGPETITINRTFDGTYHYYVTNYSKGAGIDTTYGFKDSEATVSIYNEKGKFATIGIPREANARDEIHWKVFSVDGSTGSITIENKLSDVSGYNKLVADNQSANFKLNIENFESKESSFFSKSNIFVNRLNKTSSDSIYYLWDFGDGNSSMVEFPVHTYQNSGKYSVTLRSSDGANYSIKTYTDFIEVFSNLPPVVRSIDSLSIKEDSTIAIPVSATDPDGDNLTFTVASDTNTVKVKIENKLLTLTPDPNWNGDADITVKVSDGELNDSVSFILTVEPVQDPPQSFEWISTASDSINITKDNINSGYTLKWTESKDVDNETIDYIMYAKIGVYPMQEIYDTTALAYQIPYEEIAEGAFEGLPGNTATVRFTVWAHDGTDSVQVGGDDRILFVNRYEYLSIETDGIPTEFVLHDNYPNPFNPSTQIRFDIPVMGNVNLIIYNMLGQKVRTFKMQSAPAGYHALTWDATNDLGAPVSAGIYLYQLQTDEFIKTKKMVLLK